MKIALGTDHGGVRLKQDIINAIQQLGHEVVDVGCNCTDSVDYPDYALPVCEQVVTGEVDRGILVCGTGIGMSIAANKVTGIRCALVHDVFSAKATREHNDSNVLALGERVVGPGLACEIVKEWLKTEFSGEERHVNRVNKIKLIEKRNLNV
ncbi:putative sugar phosphate isomerase YwlF [compost metagenome]